MKLTVITSESGDVVAVQYGHASDRQEGTPHATITAGPEQHLHEVDVPEVSDSISAQELLDHAAAHLNG